MSIYPLKQSYTNHGMLINLIERVDNVALYSTQPINGAICGYEIHIVRVRPVIPLFQQHDPKKYEGFTHYECNPSDADFGNWGFAFQNLETAKKKFDEILLRKNLPKGEAKV